MIPNSIIVDVSGPENGADIKKDCILVREENLDQLLLALTQFMHQIHFKVFTKEGYYEQNPKNTTPN